MQVVRHLRYVRVVLLALALAGCPPPLAPEPPTVVRPGARAVASWPPVLVERVPGQAALPWPLRAGAAFEMWRIDLLEIDRPEPAPWLEDWEPRPALLARRVLVDAASLAGGQVPIARPGAYVVRAQSRGEAHVGLVLASRLRLALLLDDSDLEVLCADARSGQPVQGAFVRVVYRTERLGGERVLSASGTTDATGRWHTSLVRDRFAPTVVATAVAVHNNHYALATARRDLDHSDASFRLTLRSQSAAFHPGQRAEFTGVLQRRDGLRLAPVGNAPIRLELLDPAGNATGVARVRTSAVGAFSDAFLLASGATGGPYVVVAWLEDEPLAEPREFELFRVLPRRPLPFRLQASLDRAVLSPGDAVTLSLAASTADRKPMAGARVRLLSWGYPVSLEGTPAWVRSTAPLDDARVVPLPVGFPAEATTDKDGKLELTWRPGRDELPLSDLVCAVQAVVAGPQGGSVRRTAEFLLLGAAPLLAVESDAAFLAPSERFSLTFATSLPPQAQREERAVCTLTYEEPAGRQHVFQVLEAPVAALADRRLVVTASKPGRYAFTARVRDSDSRAVVWVVQGNGAVPWSGASGPSLLTARPWCKRGARLQALVAAPRGGGPVALTVRSGGLVERQSVPVWAGARGLRLTVLPEHHDPIRAALVQVHAGAVEVGRAVVGVEPGGRTLEVGTRLLWVRQGEWSGRGFGISARDRLGAGVQSIVHTELLRPTFQGLPPAGVQRHTLQWHGGDATSAQGELEAGFEEGLLAKSYALFIEALAPDGRAGSALLPTHARRAAPLEPRGAPRPPRERLAALARHGFDDPMARWLAARLIAQQPKLAAHLASLAAKAKTDDAALALLRLAVPYPGAALPALEAALARADADRPGALAIAADFAAEARPIVQQVLAADPDPEVRRAAARVVGRSLPLSLPSLAQALGSDTDPLVRAAVASTLGNGDEAAATTLAEALRSEAEAEVRLAIVGALRRLGGCAAAEALLDTLGVDDPELALAALRALGDIGYRGTDSRVLRVLRKGKPPLQAEAARVLAKAGTPEATRAICAATERHPTAPLVEALTVIRSRSVRAAMAQWLGHEDPAIRLAAAEYLAALNDERACPVLRGFLDPAMAPELAERAAKALIARRSEAAALKLVQLLEAGRLSPATRAAVVRTAGELGWHEAGRAIVAILWRGLAEPQRLRSAEGRQLWVAAVRAAAGVGPIWDAEVERAVGEAPAGSPYAPALAALRSEGVASLLRALWHSPLPADLRRETVAPYARLQGKAAAADLVRLLESPVLQGPAVPALANTEAVEALLVALSHRSPYTRGAAAAALGAIGTIRAVPALDPLLNDPDPFVRLEAAHALAAISRRPVIYTDHLGEPRQATP